MGRKMLERLGYVVTTVTDAAAAVEQFSRRSLRTLNALVHGP